MDLQAIRYVAMVPNIALHQVVVVHQAHLDKNGIEGNAAQLVNKRLESPLFKGFSPEQPNIVLVSEGNSSDLTTCALWLSTAALTWPVFGFNCSAPMGTYWNRPLKSFPYPRRKTPWSRLGPKVKLRPGADALQPIRVAFQARQASMTP